MAQHGDLGERCSMSALTHTQPVDALDEQLEAASFVTDQSICYFAGTPEVCDAIAEEIQRYLDEHNGQLPDLIVTGDIAYELRRTRRTHHKIATGAKRGIPKGERWRRFKQRLKWDRMLAEHGIEWRIPPLPRTQYQRANRGEDWIRSTKSPTKSFDEDEHSSPEASEMRG
jgi:hypothetical protein